MTDVEEIKELEINEQPTGTAAAVAVDEEIKYDFEAQAEAEARASDKLDPAFTIPFESLFAFDPLKNTIQWLADR